MTLDSTSCAACGEPSVKEGFCQACLEALETIVRVRVRLTKPCTDCGTMFDAMALSRRCPECRDPEKEIICLDTDEEDETPRPTKGKKRVSLSADQPSTLNRPRVDHDDEGFDNDDEIDTIETLEVFSPSTVIRKRQREAEEKGDLVCLLSPAAPP